ncbi:hypothetical protein CBW46_014825 [Paenibacillus xerothermodurans]|uniref:Uncharacterized protein n=1 Tax=Paenibacillus xerothermodurans TaxID=1977292 RepID=A0A2W1N923_PAEXE|nr:hypothetical protein CBW46_014825 [Paenibacillus xerothermodurans]
MFGVRMVGCIDAITAAALLSGRCTHRLLPLKLLLQPRIRLGAIDFMPTWKKIRVLLFHTANIRPGSTCQMPPMLFY